MKLLKIMNPSGRWPFHRLNIAISRDMIILGFEEGLFKLVNK